MNASSSCCGALLVALVSAPAIAQADLPLNLTREVLEAAGTRAGLQKLPALARWVVQNEPSVAELAPDERCKLEEQLAAAVEPEAMYHTMVQEMLKRFHEVHFREFLAVARTPLFERFVELDLSSLEPEVLRASDAYLKTLTAVQLQEPRALLLGELDDAIGASAVEAELELKGLSGLLMRRADETEEAFAERHEQLRQRVYAAARVEFIGRQLFVYRNVSDADLERFVRLHQSEPVSYTERVIAVASLVVMSESLDRLFSTVGQ